MKRKAVQLGDIIIKGRVERAFVSTPGLPQREKEGYYYYYYYYNVEAGRQRVQVAV